MSWNFTSWVGNHSFRWKITWSVRLYVKTIWPEIHWNFIFIEQKDSDT